MFYLRRFSGFADTDADLVSLSMSDARCLGVSVLPIPIRSVRFAADVGEDMDARRLFSSLNTGTSAGERDGDTDCTRLRPLLLAPALLRRGVVTALISS